MQAGHAGTEAGWEARNPPKRSSMQAGHAEGCVRAARGGSQAKRGGWPQRKARHSATGASRLAPVRGPQSRRGEARSLWGQEPEPRARRKPRFPCARFSWGAPTGMACQSSVGTLADNRALRSQYVLVRCRLSGFGRGIRRLPFLAADGGAGVICG